MDKLFDPKKIETHWYNVWEQAGYFKPTGQGAPYCIVIPPPNVTGTLHMGHAFQYTLMDALIRYHRTSGYNTLWQVGTDHAGIATQMVVERQLAEENLTRLNLGRETFIERIWMWKEKSGSTITQQMRRLGNSVDWTRERFTMDAGLSSAVQETFIRLHREGLIYRGQRLVNWDPVLRTALSDLEVMSAEEEGMLWHIRYPLKTGAGFVTVATTRPETLLGDMAVAVHPEDPRYTALLGQTLVLPLCDREIPIIGDTYVEPGFGSGCVKITPAHDFNDYDVGRRHSLSLMNIFTPEACLNDAVPAAYRGLDRVVAREKIIADLEALGLLEKAVPYRRLVPRGDRSGAVLEPYLTDQWYIHMKSLAAAAIDVVEQGKIRFVPEGWEKTYFQWLHHIEDWCISRQLWWGHRIPAWYDETGQVYVGRSEAEVRQQHQLPSTLILRQDDDVLDTWFSSALWPFSTMGWPESTADLKTFYPTQVLVTGFDILFFWVARMVMMGMHLVGEIPFHQVYITPLVRDHEGKKMSKSKGNIIDPLDLIDGIDLETLVKKRTAGLMQPQMAKKIETETRQQFPAGIKAYGTDALRFYFCALASHGRNVCFDLDRLEGYRNFCTKLWNAARYVLMNTEGKMIGLHAEERSLGVADIWIISRLQQRISAIHTHFAEYRFDLLAQELYEFAWNDYCDWYLELVKPVLNNTTESVERQQGTRWTLLTVLETLLRCLHPIMPFITEEIWQQIAPRLAIANTDSVLCQAYPVANTALIQTEVEAEIAWVQAVILGIRSLRGELGVSPTQALSVFLQKGNESDRDRWQQQQALLIGLGRLSTIRWLPAGEIAPPAATALVGSMEILIPLAGLVDVPAELARLEKEILRLSKERDGLAKRLSNADFMARAPKEVVAKDEERLATLSLAVQQLQTKKEKLQQVF